MTAASSKPNKRVVSTHGKSHRIRGKKRATLYQILRLVYLIFIFFTGCLSIILSQVIVKVLFHNDPEHKTKLLQFTKQCFLTLLVYVTSVASPAEVIITFGDSPSLKNVIYQNPKTHRYQLRLDPKAVIISNHQIYADWVFVWFIAYLNDCADQIFIVMKKSLLKIPLIGWGMKNYNFVFLSRNWAKDRNYMYDQFKKIEHLGTKCWLLIFPEGTNMSNNTIARSNAYADKIHCKKPQCVLLPRARGLYLACKTLGTSMNAMYNLTVGYGGHPADVMAQDIYTLKSIYLFGKGPKTVSIRIDSVDMGNEVKKMGLQAPEVTLSKEQEEEEIGIFTKWISNIWYKKDDMMKEYYSTGKFPNPSGKEYRTPLKLKSKIELLNVYAIPFLAIFAGVIISKFVSRLQA